MRCSFAFLMFLAGLPALAESPVSFGVKGGFLLTDSTVGFTHSEDRWYTLGPTVEVRLPYSLGVEFNPLYKHTGFTNEFTDLLGSYYLFRARYNVWEFPVLGKYYRGPFFAAGGYTARRKANDNSTQYVVSRGIDGQIISVISGPIDVGTSTDQGFAAGGGARLPLFGRVKLSAEYRYSRWVTVEQSERRGVVSGLNKNQHEILIGFTF